MEIVRPANDPYETISLWALLQETVPQTVRDKSPSPVLAGATARAILSNTDYPAALLNGVMLRIRADRKITRGRAAILKAYYLKNPHTECPKEVLTVSLNETSSIVPYNLGRLFSVLEAIQQAANPGINTTIKDKYFNSAAATPAVIFPVLINLAQKHLKKLRGSNAGLVVFYEKQLTELCSRIGKAYPAHMNLPQQGSFQLGYYCQTQARYQKKEEAKDV
jgi:CRISPR-associated protein Csd1